MEYGNVVFDNFEYEKSDVEKIQVKKNKIVFGTTKFVSMNNLYRENGRLILGVRQTFFKLIFVIFKFSKRPIQRNSPKNNELVERL